MAWLVLALVGVVVYAVLSILPDSRQPGPRYDRRSLHSSAAGREQQRREHEVRCAGRCEQSKS